MDSKRLTRDTALTLIAAYLGLFVGLVDANAINLALPAIRTELGGGIAGAQWTIDAYNVTFAAVGAPAAIRSAAARAPCPGQSARRRRISSTSPV